MLIAYIDTIMTPHQEISKTNYGTNIVNVEPTASIAEIQDRFSDRAYAALLPTHQGLPGSIAAAVYL